MAEFSFFIPNEVIPFTRIVRPAAVDCFRLERIAGWALHPLESAALSRRTPMSDIHPLVRLNRSAMRRLAAVGLVAPVSMVKAAGGIAASEAMNWSRNFLSRSSERSFPNAARSGFPIRLSCSSRDNVRRTKMISPPAASTACLARSGKSGATDASGAKVKIKERPASAASWNIASQSCSRSLTNRSLPNGKTAATKSTTR